MKILPTPSWDSTQPRTINVTRNRDIITSWITSEWLDNLAQAWQRVPPSEVQPRLDFFRDMADGPWDFRRGRERNEAAKADLTASQIAVVAEGARALGLVDVMPLASAHYSSVLVLGGLLRGCLTRTLTAKELLNQNVSADSVVGLGGTRKLTDGELEQGKELGIRATTEYEAMLSAMDVVFHPGASPLITSHDDPEPNGSWSITEYESVPRIAVVSAPSLAPKIRRANTSDTLVWWRERSGETGANQFLLITHQIYVPYQAATAVRTYGLPHNAGVEFTGVTSTAADLGPLTQEFSVQNYLQEIGSAIRGYADLWSALE